MDIELPQDVESELPEDVDEVPKEEYDHRVPSPNDMVSWLRSPTGISEKTNVGMELYSPPRVLASAAVVNLAIGIFSFDIIHGWDLQREDLQKITIQLVQLGIISFLCLSPPCTMFSELQRLFNQKKMDPAIWDARMTQAIGFIRHCMAAAVCNHKKENVGCSSIHGRPALGALNVCKQCGPCQTPGPLISICVPLV